MGCPICSSLKLHSFDIFSSLKRVTSDAKTWPAGGELLLCNTCGLVQKAINNKLLEEIKLIYSNYEIYHQSEGQEQAVFNPTGSPQKRSEVIANFIYESQFFHNDKKCVLDYGCGNGEFLNAFGKIYPDFSLHGLDLSNKYKLQLESIPNFTALYNPESLLEKKFDFIALIHTLEHLTNPVDTLRLIRSYLKPEGHIFVQVPNVQETPFDILIADHLWHFSPKSLTNILIQAGFTIIAVNTKIVSKEISICAVPNFDALHNAPNLDDSKDIKRLIHQYIEFNLKLIADTEQIQKQGEFGIFGTSISATWLYNYFNNVDFFIDEDPNRIGKLHFNKPIYSPQSMYGKKTPIAIPLPPSIASQIIARHFEYNGVFLTPRIDL